MVTRGARIMAVAAFATSRCCSFLHGSSKFVRTAPTRGCSHLRATPQVEQIAKAHEGQNGRANVDNISLDTAFVAKNPEVVLGHLQARRMGQESVDAVNRIGDLMDSRREYISTKDSALNKRKTLSAQIGKLMKAGHADEAAAQKAEVERTNEVAASAEEELNKVDDEISGLFMRLPNLLDSRVPDGGGEEDNEVVREWGQEYIKTGEKYLWHDNIVTKLGGWDPEGAVRVAGSRFSVLKGSVARMERALGQWLLDFHTTQHGYTEVSVPLLVTRSSLEGTGQLPKFENDLFKTNHLVANEDSFLIPTGEVPLTNLLRGQLLDKDQRLTSCTNAFLDSHDVTVANKLIKKAQLPLSLVALTPCFRAEAGSAGRDTRGLLRQHQFLKVELVKITTPEDSKQEHEALTQHAEAVLKALKLPFRRVNLCSGDIGFGARMCYDLEVWMAGQGTYREISSCSNCQDFQARRMSLRYREPAPVGKSKSRNISCHSINGSGVAVGRALVAILENYYNPTDGSVDIPDVLRPYMGGLETLVAMK